MHFVDIQYVPITIIYVVNTEAAFQYNNVFVYI